MQNLGRLFCLVPVARWLRLDRSEWRDFVGRHLALFNSNPFISPLGIGALARLEADHKQGRRALREGVIERFSERLSTGLGAAGDELFWAAVRPQTVLLGCLVVLLWGAWGIVVFLAGFGLWQGIYRWTTFTWGWRAGSEVASVLRERAMRVPARWAGYAAAVCAGGLTAFLAMQQMGQADQGLGRWLPGLVFAVSALGAGLWAYRQRRVTWALVGGILCGLLASAIESALGG